MDASTEVSHIDNSCRLVCLYARISSLSFNPSTADLTFWNRLSPAIKSHVVREYRDALKQ